MSDSLLRGTPMPTLAEVLAEMYEAREGCHKEMIIDEMNIMINYAELTDEHGEPLYPEAVEYVALLEQNEDPDYDEFEEMASNDNEMAPHPWWSMPAEQ